MPKKNGQGSHKPVKENNHNSVEKPSFKSKHYRNQTAIGFFEEPIRRSPRLKGEEPTFKNGLVDPALSPTKLVNKCTKGHLGYEKNLFEGPFVTVTSDGTAVKDELENRFVKYKDYKKNQSLSNLQFLHPQKSIKCLCISQFMQKQLTILGILLLTLGSLILMIWRNILIKRKRKILI